MFILDNTARTVAAAVYSGAPHTFEDGENRMNSLPTQPLPMLHFSPFFHGNLQYAEFSPDMMPAMVAQSYLPVLEQFAESPDLPAVFEFSGVSLELLAENWPRTIDLLRLLLQRGQIELLGSTYANPILPLIPTDHARRHVLRFQTIYEQLFGDLHLPAPAGIYLQEFAYDPTLVPLLRQAGYEYTVLTPRLLLAGVRRQFNVALKPAPNCEPPVSEHSAELLHPIQMQGAQGSTLTAMPLYRQFIDLLFDYAHGRCNFDAVAEHLHGVACQSGSRPAFLLFGPSDLEFVGVPHPGDRQAIPVTLVMDLLRQLKELPFLQFDLPRCYLEDFPPRQLMYVPAGTSELAFDLWTADADNVRLNALCNEAAHKLELARVLGVGSEATWQAAWQVMLLAENSDGRGWMPCAERRLACYDHALRAIALADEMLGRGA